MSANPWVALIFWTFITVLIVCFIVWALCFIEKSLSPGKRKIISSIITIAAVTVILAKAALHAAPYIVENSEDINAFALGAVAVAVYFVPSIIAFKHERKNRKAIFCFNLFLGWSGLGWVLALVWSFVE